MEGDARTTDDSNAAKRARACPHALSTPPRDFLSLPNEIIAVEIVRHLRPCAPYSWEYSEADIRALARVCLRLWYLLRRKRRYVLREKYAAAYCGDATFRALVNGTFDSDCVHVHVERPPGSPLAVDLAALGDVHTLSLEEEDYFVDPRPVSGVASLGRIHTLALTSAKLSADDIAALARVHKLTLERCSFLADVAPLRLVHTLKLFYCDGLSGMSALGLGRVHTLRVSTNDDIDASGFGHVHTLELVGKGIKDVSALGGVHALRLRGDHVTDVSALGGVSSVVISSCSVSDVSALRRVRTLRLSNCAKLTHVEIGAAEAKIVWCESLQSVALDASVRHLSLYLCDILTSVCATAADAVAPRAGDCRFKRTAYVFDCKGLADIGGLRGWDRVSLNKCPEVRDIRPLAGVASVSLEAVDIADIDVLSHAKSVELCVCPAVSDVSALCGVPTVVVEDCPLVTDVSALCGVKELQLRGMRDIAAVLGLVRQRSTIVGAADSGEANRYKLSLSLNGMSDTDIVDVAGVRCVDCLVLKDCASITDVSALGGVHTLGLPGCVNVVDVSALGRVRKLNLSGCLNVVDVSALGGVHTLDLSNCVNVVDVSALGRVHTLKLENCARVVDVSALGGVYKLDLRGCYGVVDFSGLVSVCVLLHPDLTKGRRDRIR